MYKEVLAPTLFYDSETHTWYEYDKSEVSGRNTFWDIFVV